MAVYTGHDFVQAFRTPKTLDDVLWAGYRHLRELDDREELVVALGQRRGSSATAPLRFDGLWRGIGDRSTSTFTPLARSIVRRQVMDVSGGCAVVIHNHPPHDLRTLFSLFLDWTPLPSSTDRETALASDMAAWRRWFETGHDGSFKWYLVEEGRMREFYRVQFPIC